MWLIILLSSNLDSIWDSSQFLESLFWLPLHGFSSWKYWHVENQRRTFFAKCTLKTFFAKCTLKCLPFFMNWCHVFLHVSIRRKAFITHLHLSFPSWTDVTFYSLMDWCYMFLHISLFRKNFYHTFHIWTILFPHGFMVYVPSY